MKTIRVTLFGAFLMCLLTACASLAPANSFGARIAYANGALNAVVNATATSLQANQISRDDAKKIRDLAEKAGAFLDAAQAAGDTPSGNNQLTLATAVLTQLQTYLNARSRS